MIIKSPEILQVIQSNSVVGKRLIPRYLYHFTSKNNFEKINNQGVILPSKELLKDKSIFLFDLENFLKFWNIIVEKYQKSLKNALIDKASNNGTQDIVLLRIDTSKLFKTDLKIRSQDRMFKPELLDSLKRDFLKYKDVLNFPKVLQEKYKIYFEGDKAVRGNLYNQRKESLEYIYPFSISKDSFDKVGEYSISQTSNKTAKDVFQILENIFRNQPEHKAIERFL